MHPRTMTLLCLAAGLTAATAQSASAQSVTSQSVTSQRRVEPVLHPLPLQRVVAAKTPSGLPVPRYVSLKYGQINGRIGPSTDHPIAWTYRRKGLPMIVVAETEMWRRVRDPEGDDVWMRKSAFTGDRHVLARRDVTLRNSQAADARAVAVLAAGAIARLNVCDRDTCEITAGARSGWVPASAIWGEESLD